MGRRNIRNICNCKCHLRTKDPGIRLLHYSNTKDRTAAANRLLVAFIVISNLPLRVVESAHFKNFLKYLAPWYRLPCKKTISKVIDDLHTKAKEKVSEKLKNKKVSITLDLATVLNSTRHFLVSTVHFINEQTSEMLSMALSVRQMTGRSTAEEIIKEMESTLTDFKISKDQVHSTCTDRGANVKKACQDLFGIGKVVFCVCHMLDNIVQDTFNGSPIIKAFLTDVKTVVAFIKRSATAANLLRTQQMKNNGCKYSACLMPIQSVPTRWNSTLRCIKRFVHLFPFIKVVLKDESLRSSNPPKVQEEVVETLDQISKLLVFIEELTKEFSSSKSITSSSAVLSIKSLIEVITNTSVNGSTANDFKKLLLKNLDRKRPNFEDNALLGACNVIDPRFKGVTLSKEQFENAVEILKTKLKNETLVDGSRASSSTQKESSDEDIMVKYFILGQPPEKRARMQDELSGYLNSPIANFKENPFFWWDKHQAEYPNLALIAKDLLMTPSASVASERLVSSVNLVLRDNRSRLLSQRLDKLCFLRSLNGNIWQELV